MGQKKGFRLIQASASEWVHLFHKGLADGETNPAHLIILFS